MGKALFGDLGLKFVNRNKDDDDNGAARRGGIKAIYLVLLALMVGIFIFEKMKGKAVFFEKRGGSCFLHRR